MSKSWQLRIAISLVAMGVIVAGYGFYDHRLRMVLWLGFFTFALGAISLLKVLRDKGQCGDQFRLCPKCGYNVTGNTTGRCPECNYLV